MGSKNLLLLRPEDLNKEVSQFRDRDAQCRPKVLDLVCRVTISTQKIKFMGKSPESR